MRSAGGTGRDSTPEAVKVLLDKEIEGFGEVFRGVSYEEMNASSIQLRALAGVGRPERNAPVHWQGQSNVSKIYTYVKTTFESFVD